jgi:hypothetical protein
MQNARLRYGELRHQDRQIVHSQREEHPLNFHSFSSQADIPRYPPPPGDGSIASAYNLETAFCLEPL